MKRLDILRHAKAAAHKAAASDFDRPLAPRGAEDVARFSEWAKERVKPDATLVSSALRTVQTLETLQAGLGRSLHATVSKELYLADIDDLIAALRDVGDAGEVLLIGHNPGLEELASALLGEDLAMPTCGFVSVDLPIDEWSRLDRDVRGKQVVFRVS